MKVILHNWEEQNNVFENDLNLAMKRCNMVTSIQFSYVSKPVWYMQVFNFDGQANKWYKNMHFQNMYIKVKHPDTYDEVGYNISDD